MYTTTTTTTTTTTSSSIILFDGVCNLCNGFVQFILLRDSDEVFKMASLQSEIGQELLGNHGLGEAAFSTVVLIENQQAYTHSSAVLRILPQLKGGWQWTKFLRFIPRPIRDVVYRWVAHNRYKWFGKQASCMLPRPEWKSRFL